MEDGGLKKQEIFQRGKATDDFWLTVCKAKEQIFEDKVKEEGQNQRSKLPWNDRKDANSERKEKNLVPWKDRKTYWEFRWTYKFAWL